MGEPICNTILAGAVKLRISFLTRVHVIFVTGLHISTENPEEESEFCLTSNGRQQRHDAVCVNESPQCNLIFLTYCSCVLDTVVPCVVTAPLQVQLVKSN